MEFGHTYSLRNQDPKEIDNLLNIIGRLEESFT